MPLSWNPITVPADVKSKGRATRRELRRKVNGGLYLHGASGVHGETYVSVKMAEMNAGAGEWALQKWQSHRIRSDRTR